MARHNTGLGRSGVSAGLSQGICNVHRLFSRLYQVPLEEAAVLLLAHLHIPDAEVARLERRDDGH